MVVATIGISLLIIVLLVIYNIRINQQLKAYGNVTQKINSLSVLQNFMSVAGDDLSVDEKINKINEIVIDKYNIKYSTIVIYNGAEFVIKASNVDKKYYETLLNLQNEPIFKDSVSTATPKYVTVEKQNEKLPYQKFDLARAKSAMFFPLYIDNIYIGYWIMESGMIHAFDDLDTTIIDVVKENIISVIKSVSYQETMENIVRKDLFSGLKSAEYLYGEAKRIVDSYTSSAVVMFRITNLEEINENISRKMGNNIITEVSQIVKEKISENYIFVRYMGPKFVIVFPNISVEGVEQFISELKADIESLELVAEFEYDEERQLEFGEEEITANPLVNFAITTYYKGTGIEKVTKRLEEYLDNASKEENEINYI